MPRRQLVNVPEDVDQWPGRTIALFGAKGSGKTQTMLQAWAYAQLPGLYIDPPGAATDDVTAYNGQTLTPPRITPQDIDGPDDPSAEAIRDLWTATEDEIAQGRSVHWDLSQNRGTRAKHLLDLLAQGELQSLPPTTLLLDEAHVYASKPGGHGVGVDFINYLSEARNYGHTVVYASQRPAKIHASLEDETDLTIVLKLGMKSLKYLDRWTQLPLDVLPVHASSISDAKRELRNKVGGQRPGEALIIDQGPPGTSH